MFEIFSKNKKDCPSRDKKASEIPTMLLVMQCLQEIIRN